MGSPVPVSVGPALYGGPGDLEAGGGFAERPTVIDTQRPTARRGGASGCGTPSSPRGLIVQLCMRRPGSASALLANGGSSPGVDSVPTMQMRLLLHSRSPQVKAAVDAFTEGDDPRVEGSDHGAGVVPSPPAIGRCPHHETNSLLSHLERSGVVSF